MRNLVIGMGQIGAPLARLLEERWPTFTRDKESVDGLADVHILHICYPFDKWFIANTRRYVEQYSPALTVVHSTVVPGATAAIAHGSPGEFVYSPVRGRHGEMYADLKHYTKFIAGSDKGIEIACQIFEGAGLNVGVFRDSCALELAKLLETTYSGLLVAWAQEMSRFCQDIGAEYLDVMRFMAEIDYLPRVAFQPGHIGGHCIIDNLGLLEQQRGSLFLSAIRSSNAHIVDTGERLRPIPMGELWADS
jgi:UDP-N-acetyl-D-mannosaminuronate dehydrogenase